MTTSVKTNDDANVLEARALCIAEVNLLIMKGDLLTGGKVASIINDFCIELRCRRDQMPYGLSSLYRKAIDMPTKLFNTTDFIRLLDQAV